MKIKTYIEAKLHSIDTDDASVFYLQNNSLERGPELEHPIGLHGVTNKQLYITIPHYGSEIQIGDHIIVGHNCLQVLDFTLSNDKKTKNGFKLSNNTIVTNSDCRRIIFTTNKKLDQYQQLNVSSDFFNYIRDILANRSRINIR